MRETNGNFDSCNSVYMSCMSQNFRLFHVSNLYVRNFRIFLLMYPGSRPLRTSRDTRVMEQRGRSRQTGAMFGARATALAAFCNTQTVASIVNNLFLPDDYIVFT